MQCHARSCKQTQNVLMQQNGRTFPELTGALSAISTASMLPTTVARFESNAYYIHGDPRATRNHFERFCDGETLMMEKNFRFPGGFVSKNPA